MAEEHPGLIQRLTLGARRGLGDGNHAILLASRAALRRGSNWVLPAGMGLLLAAVLASLHLYADNGFGYVALRIILIDYLVFVFGWMGGWGVASRWRRNHEFIEELVVTNLRPAVVGNLLFAGALAVWAPILVVLGLVDIVSLLAMPERLGLLSREEPGLEALPVSLILTGVFASVMVIFHLETLRIAYWMFSSAALPKVNLRHKAIANFFLIPVYVFALTAMGGFLTLISWLLVMLLSMPFNGGSDLLDSEMVWMVASLPGLALVALFKRLIARAYENTFWRAYLMFCWYGAAEREHPVSYPLNMYDGATKWGRFLTAEERALARGSARPPQPPTPAQAQANPEDEAEAMVRRSFRG